MNNSILLGIFYEIIWFAIAATAGYLLVLPVKNEISNEFFNYLWASIFLVFTYLRFIAFMTRSVILENVFVKIGLFILNIPLFFFVMNQYFKFIDVFDDYDYTLAKNLFQYIHSGTEVDDILYIKKLTVFSGISSMVVIVLMELRIIYSIFKQRQLDKYL
jgi:hypothetical protein